MGIYGKDEDFFTLKGMVVTLLERLGIEDLNLQQSQITRYIILADVQESLQETKTVQPLNWVSWVRYTLT